MHPVIEELVASGPVVVDGAWGTELQQRGLAPGEFPDVWNLRFPGRVLEVAQAYIRAGSRIILTNTFGGNRFRLAVDGLESQLPEINQAGVEISRAAAGAQGLVFASMGPTGKLLMDEAVSADQVRDAFAEQGRALAGAGAHGFVIETMSDVAEAVLAVEAVVGLGLPIVASLVFDSGRGKDCTMMGQTPEQAAQALANAGADVIGANCGAGLIGFDAICRRLKKTANRPVWLKPNAGLPRMVDGRATYDVRPASFAESMVKLAAAGGDFIGGCCGTRPEFIREIGQRIAAR